MTTSRAFDPAVLRTRAERFSTERFEASLRDVLTETLMTGGGMLRRYNRLLVAIHVIADLVSAAAAFALAYWLRFDSALVRFIPITKGTPLLREYIAILPLVALLVPLAFQVQGLYRLRRGRTRVDDFFAVLVGTILAVLAGVVITLFLEPITPIGSRQGSVSQVVWVLFLTLNILLRRLARARARSAAPPLARGHRPQARARRGRRRSGPHGGRPDPRAQRTRLPAAGICRDDRARIRLMIQNGDFFSAPTLLAAMKSARAGGRRLHLFGLVSDGGVHSYQTHLHALLKMARQNGVDQVLVHAFMDGRDTLPTNGAGYLEQLQQKMREYNTGKIASVNGRYYAMDRDRRWERIAKRSMRWSLATVKAANTSTRCRA